MVEPSGVDVELTRGATTSWTSTVTCVAPSSPSSQVSGNGTASTNAATGNSTFALHIIAVSQLRHPWPGRVYYDRKRAEGTNTKEALRALKRQISDVVNRTMVADAKRMRAGPGGHPGTTSNPA